MAPAGRVLLSADYAQMELRLMAHLSGDASLIATLSDPLQDPFTQWAAQWLRIPPHAVGAPEPHMPCGRISMLVALLHLLDLHLPFCGA